MTDIVERLRQHGSDVSNWAADEIERLSAWLDAATLDSVCTYCGHTTSSKSQAERATAMVDHMLECPEHPVLKAAAILADYERLRARRAVVCGTCQGGGKVRNFHGDLPSSFPYDCPDCGQDGCEPGVQWSET